MKKEKQSGEKDTLIDIASQCPFEGGIAVLIARKMVQHFSDTIYWDDSTACSGGSPRIAKYFDEITGFIAPNPAADYINLYYPLNRSLKYIIQIFSTPGHLLNQINIYGKAVIKIDVHNLPNGIYLIKILKQDHSIIDIRKFVILK